MKCRHSLSLTVLVASLLMIGSVGLGQAEGADENLAGLESFGLCALIQSRDHDEESAESLTLARMERVASEIGLPVRGCFSSLSDADIVFSALELNEHFYWTLQVILDVGQLRTVSIWAAGGIVTNAGSDVVSDFVDSADRAIRDLADAWRSQSGVTGMGQPEDPFRASPQGSQVAAPTNDAFASATVLQSASGSRAFSNVGATREPGEPSHAGATGGASIWWSWQAPADGTLTVDTLGSSFDTLLAVYTGRLVGALQEVGANDDEVGGTSLASLVEIPVVAGTEYRIAVDGYLGATGTGTLRTRFAPRTSTPSGSTAEAPVATTARTDRFAAATVISGPSGSVTGSNVGAGREIGEGSHDIFFATASVWWAWTAPSGGVYIFNTDGSSIDAVIAIYTGTSLTNLVPVVSAGPTDLGATEVALAATAGTTYRIAVDGVFGEMGEIRLNWRRR